MNTEYEARHRKGDVTMYVLLVSLRLNKENPQEQGPYVKTISLRHLYYRKHCYNL